MDLPNNINKEAYLEFLEHRKELRKPVKPTGIKKQIQFLSQFDFTTQAKIIDQSIMNGWQGMFPLKQVSQPTYSQYGYSGLIPTQNEFRERQINKIEKSIEEVRSVIPRNPIGAEKVGELKGLLRMH